MSASGRSGLSSSPSDDATGYQAAVALYDAGRFEEALRLAVALLDAAPAFVHALTLAAACSHHLGHSVGEEAYLRRLVALQPDDTLTCYNLGVLLFRLKRLSEAQMWCERALALSPDFAEAHNSLGLLLSDLGRTTGAEAALRRALALRPGWPDAEVNLAHLLLSLGRYAEGWARYEARNAAGGSLKLNARPSIESTLWRGETLRGKSLLVWHEQGYGDMIQFGRYLPMLRAMGASRVVLACPQILHVLFASVEGIEIALDTEAAASDARCDYWTPAMSLPHFAGTTVDSIPPAVYLRADPMRIVHWQPRLPDRRHGRRIGLVWKGTATHVNDRARSLPSLATLAPLWSVPGVQFVSVQKGRGEEEANHAPRDQPIVPLGCDIGDFADSAAIVSQLDLLISVDTSAAHLAGSLGVPCWVLLPSVETDWRWQREGTRSPWYPQTTRLFRQAGSDWSQVVAQVRDACAECVPTGFAG